MGWWPMLFEFDDGLVMHGGMQTNSDVVREAICVAPCPHKNEAHPGAKYHMHPGECSCEGEHVMAWWEPDEGWHGKACRVHGSFKGPREPYGYDGGYHPEHAIPPVEMVPLAPGKWDAWWDEIQKKYDAKENGGGA